MKWFGVKPSHATGAGRRAKVEAEGRRGGTTLTRRPATHNRSDVLGCFFAPLIAADQQWIHRQRHDDGLAFVEVGYGR